MRLLTGTHGPKEHERKNDGNMKRILRICICLAVFMTAGCIKEDLSNCESTFQLTVKAYANDGTDCAADVDEVILYVFDSDLNYLEEIETFVNQTVPVKVRANEQIHIYAWGNLSGGSETRPVFSPGDPISAGLICLIPDVRAASLYLSPDDLFQGNVSIAGTQRGGEVEVPIRRETGSMSVTVKGLKEFAGFADDDYSIVVRDTYNTYEMDATLSGGRASYRPSGFFMDSDAGTEYGVPPFRLVPEQNGVNIDIYHGTDLLVTVSSHNSGQPITVVKGLLTQVVIEFNVTLNVSVELLPWGSEGGGKEF